MTARTEAYKLAAAIGATLEYRRARHTKQVDIYLAQGTCFDGNAGLDALHHECELDEDIWPGVLADLQCVGPPMHELRYDT